MRHTAAMVLAAALALGDASGAHSLAGPPDMPASARALGAGMASYYAQNFEGQRTASGEPYRRAGLTAAHRSAPFGSRIRVRNLGNGREVVVRVNDRGPWSRGRIIDLSWAAAVAIGLHRTGTARVSLTMLDRAE